MDEASTAEAIQQDWFHAVKAYHEHSFRSPSSFLNSNYAIEYGLDSEDIREFRRAVQSFDIKWQAAAKAYIQGKYPTRKRFVSSGRFLTMGFSPSREHSEVLRFALKFYDEEKKYRKNADSDAVTTAGRWGGSAKPMFSVTKVRTPNRVVGFDSSILNSDGLPTLLGLEDDVSFGSSSRGSGESSTTCSFIDRESRIHTENLEEEDLEKDYVQTLLCELSDDRNGNNPVDAMIFFVFAIIPLVIFAQAGVIISILIPGRRDPQKELDDEPADIESVWEELRANALFSEERLDIDF